MEGSAKYPLQILPKEIWEMIILKVKDSEDLRSLMKASKQLNNTFMYIHHLWLLDKVLPMLMPITKPVDYRYLEMEDLKELRLVDKRWNRGVNTFLENQPDLRPYNKDDDKVNSEEHIWQKYCQKFDYPAWNWRPTGGVTFDNFDQIDIFSEEFENQRKSPFFTRSLVGCTKLDISLEEDDDNENVLRRYPGPVGQGKQAFWEDIIHTIFNKFGKNIWFLTMTWMQDDCKWWDQGPVWKSIVNSLSSLPNLKGLHLDFDSMDCYFKAKEFLQLEENQLPSLPFLESLKVITYDSDSDDFSPTLVSKYCLQLRRLQLHIHNWDARQEWTFPNLIELGFENADFSKDVTLVLKSLNAPQLAKLELASSAIEDADWRYGNDPYENDHHELNVEDFFAWITFIPSLLHLDISCTNFIIKECVALKVPHDLKPSLKYLKIHNSHGVNYNFLRCLPNLERLQISVDREPVVWDCSAYPDIRIKLEIETSSLYQSNVWELCPKLKTISLRFADFNELKAYHEFDRVTFEKLKYNPEPTAVAFKLRQELLKFLVYNKKD